VAIGSKSRGRKKNRAWAKLCREGNWSDSWATYPRTRNGSCGRTLEEPSASLRRRTRRGRCSTPPPPRGCTAGGGRSVASWSRRNRGRCSAAAGRHRGGGGHCGGGGGGGRSGARRRRARWRGEWWRRGRWWKRACGRGFRGFRRRVQCRSANSVIQSHESTSWSETTAFRIAARWCGVKLQWAQNSFLSGFCMLLRLRLLCEKG